MIVPTFAQRPIFGYSWIVLAAIGTAFISFGLWVHHMYTTGLPMISLGFFSAASEAVAIPTGIQIFAFIATVLTGNVIRSTPMLWVTGALAIFVFGGLTGVMVALAPFDWQAHDTYFVVAHLHYVLIGGMLFPVIAGIYYYFPLVAAKKLSPRLGRWAFWLMFIGFNVTFFPMHFTGLLGMPRRVFTYPADLGWDWLNLTSSIGAFVLAAGFATVVWDVIRPKGKEPLSERNPWNAGTLEWMQEMPGKPWGARSVPLVQSRYPLWQQPNFLKDYDEGRFYLSDAEELKRETIVTTALDAEPIQVQRVSGPTFVTMWAAAFTGGSFIFATYHWWWPAGASGVLAMATIIYWLWTATGRPPEKPEKDIGHGLVLPLYASGPYSCGWWAMFITMTGDVIAFSGLVFGYFFFWTIHENFPPDASPGPGLFWPAVALALVAVSWALTTGARMWNDRDRPDLLRLALVAAVPLAGAGALALLAGPHLAGLDPTAHVYPATVWILAGWTALHLALGIVMQLYVLARSLAGLISATYDGDIWNVALYWHFTAATALVTVAVIAVFPLLA